MRQVRYLVDLARDGLQKNIPKPRRPDLNGIMVGNGLAGGLADTPTQFWTLDKTPESVKPFVFRRGKESVFSITNVVRQDPDS